MIRRLIILLLIVGCATIPVENRKSTEYTLKMNEDEYKELIRQVQKKKFKKDTIGRLSHMLEE